MLSMAFGGTPDHWLAGVPVEMFRYCARFLGKHSAQRRLQTVIDMAVATGKVDGRDHLDELRLAAQGRYRIAPTVHDGGAAPFTPQRATLKKSVRSWLGKVGR